jgi:RNA polymerase sigma-70 factor, ECF subfamily
LAVTEDEFVSLYRDKLPLITKFFARRAEPSEMEDLASKTFEIAWVKRASIEKGFELPFLYKVAGYVLANHKRAMTNRAGLISRLKTPDWSPSAEEIAVADLELARAWSRLSATERQVIALSVFDGLGNQEAAKVLEISTNGFAIKLSRAKSKLKIFLDES